MVSSRTPHFFLVFDLDLSQKLHKKMGLLWWLPPAQTPLPVWQRLWISLSTSAIFQLLLVLLDSVSSALRGGACARARARDGAGAGAAPARFAVLSAPRSGSTLLVSLLNAHPSICCAGEVLNARFEHYGNVEGSPCWRQRLHVRACT